MTFAHHEAVSNPALFWELIVTAALAAMFLAAYVRSLR